jgi:glycosyltransferase involved in cell wall biosynthesis
LRGRVSAWLLYKWVLPRSDYVFSQTDRMKENICAYGIDPAKVSPIVTGFGLREIEPIRRPPPSTDKPPVLAYLGTLSADRHLEVLVDMLASLRAQGMEAKLLLIGDADRSRDRAMLERRAAEQGVAHQLEITGMLPHAQALARIADVDICLSPIYRSPIFDVGSPTKMIEYMALGMPIVANDHPEQQQILRESRAGVCVPWQPRHFARAVRWLMQRSPAERAEMGARGRAWVEANRTYARIADDVERACIRVLRSSLNRNPSTHAIHDPSGR